MRGHARGNCARWTPGRRGILCDPTQILAQGVYLVIENGMGEQRNLVYELLPPRGVLRQKNHPSAHAFLLAAKAGDLVVDRSNLHNLHADLWSDVREQRRPLACSFEQNDARPVTTDKSEHFRLKASFSIRSPGAQGENRGGRACGASSHSLRGR
jgi:hypothetical protein